jgi:hypothetical protein
MKTFLSPSKNIYSVVVDELSVGYLRGDLSDDEWIAKLDWGRVHASGATGTLTLNIDLKVSSKQRSLARESQSHKGLRRIALLPIQRWRADRSRRTAGCSAPS